MNNSELREVAESIDRGDKATLGALDFEFTVTDIVEDPNHGSLSIFGRKDHHPEEGLFTNVVFGVDTPDVGVEIAVEVYDDEEYANKVDEEVYHKIESVAVVE